MCLCTVNGAVTEHNVHQWQLHILQYPLGNMQRLPDKIIDDLAIVDTANAKTILLFLCKDSYYTSAIKSFTTYGY